MYLNNLNNIIFISNLKNKKCTIKMYNNKLI